MVAASHGGEYVTSDVFHVFLKLDESMLNVSAKKVS